MTRQFPAPLAAALVFMIVLWGCKSPTESTKLGPAWVSFTRSTTAALRSDYIRCVAVDGDGRVWFGTDSGASSYLSGSWGFLRDSLAYQTYGPFGPVTRYQVNTITAGMDGSIWFGTDGGGVRRYDRFSTYKTWWHYDPPEVASDFVISIAAEKYQRGDVWVGTKMGLSHMIPNATNPNLDVWEQNPLQCLTSTQIYSAAVSVVNDALWVGTQEGAARNDDNGCTYYIIHPSAYNYAITGIAADYSTYVWFSKLQGVTRLDLTDGVMTNYTYDNTNAQLPFGTINAVATDLFATHWFGTNAGLIRLKDTTWTTFNRSNSPIPSDTVLSVAYDKLQNLWVGTAHGVAVYKEGGTAL